MATETPRDEYSVTKADRDRLKAQATFDPITGFIARCELLYIIYPIEAFFRLWYHLDPRLYFERLRIKRVSEGTRLVRGKRFALLILYARTSVPVFTQTLIDAIERRGLNLIISTNAKIHDELRSELLAKSCLLIERADLGRDFGGYKDAIAIIRRRFGTPDRLLLFNDSLFFFSSGLDEFIERFDGDEDLYAMTEVFEHHYHLGSFALSFGRNVLQHRRFLRYWQAYRPVSTRRWSVNRGEVGLTQMLMRAGFQPRVLYHGARVLPQLLKLDGREFLDAIRLFPSALRSRLFILYDEFQAEQRGATLSAINSYSRGIRRFGALDDHADLRQATVRQLLELSRDAAATQMEQERWARLNICREAVSTITKRNQMHVGGFIFRKFLGMPALKRDIFFREVFRLSEIEDILIRWNEPLRNAIIADLRQKGTQRHLKGLARLLAKHGSI